jgi:hypothetical protein
MPQRKDKKSAIAKRTFTLTWTALPEFRHGRKAPDVRGVTRKQWQSNNTGDDNRFRGEACFYFPGGNFESMELGSPIGIAS